MALDAGVLTREPDAPRTRVTTSGGTARIEATAADRQDIGSANAGVTDRLRREGPRVLRVMSAMTLVGLLAGAVIGGLGGRIAMRIVTFQSDPALDGVITDDRAEVNVVSWDGTLFLIFLTMVMGALGGGVLYCLVRAVVPPGRSRVVGFTALVGLVGGTLFVHSSGVDYTILGSTWVSVAMFIGLPLAYGITVSLGAERLLRPRGYAERAPRWLVPVPFAGLFAFVVPVAMGTAVVVAVRSLLPPGVLGHPALVWLGRSVLVALATVAGVSLVRTLVELA